MPLSVGINKEFKFVSPFGLSPCLVQPFIKGSNNNWVTTSGVYSSSSGQFYGITSSCPGDGFCYLSTGNQIINGTQGSCSPPSDYLHSSEIVLGLYCQMDNEELVAAKFEEYSEKEMIVGKWIDGNPIYRKVFQIAGPTKINENAVVSIANLNVEKVIKIEGFYFWDSTQNTMPITFVNIDGYSTIRATKKDIYMFMTSKNGINAQATIFLEYTKTTY